MNIYFSFSHSHSDETIRNYCKQIFNALTDAGHTVFPQNTLEKINNTEFASQQTSQQKEQNRKNLVKNKNSADIIILETSLPSIGIGQELQYSVSLNKPVLAIYNNDYKSNILEPFNYDKFLLLEYHPTDIKEIIEQGISYLHKTEPARFNLMLDPKLLNFVKIEARNKNISNAAYIRQLIITEKNK